MTEPLIDPIDSSISAYPPPWPLSNIRLTEKYLQVVTAFRKYGYDLKPVEMEKDD
jgi:hypothetical protein